MSGGSFERESPRDCQCPNCGLWYDSAGVVSHNNNCQFPEDRDPMVALEDARDAPDLADLADQDDDVDDERNPTEDVDELVDEAVGGLDSDPPAPSTARADGGIADLPTPDAVDGDDAGDDQDEQHDVDDDPVPECPECGSHRVYEVDDLPDWVVAAVPDLEAFDWVCDDETSLRQGNVEVFNT
ncbi:hypothetical protein SAMN04488063_0100 [Halopelagius inordinatus]|uniref:Uncharacterized protein n=1 Tax=Halopelagius inordinatus TaxID=553467 RepID=A0A1I2X4B3_9EURY|nr:hypothetical protein [Halopelagius inordinatus]SFH07536.1 hypothetical protein SAMN04488063_0100 [Halopelagius inordinatus]